MTGETPRKMSPGGQKKGAVAKAFVAPNPNDDSKQTFHQPNSMYIYIYLHVYPPVITHSLLENPQISFHSLLKKNTDCWNPTHHPDW